MKSSENITGEEIYNKMKEALTPYLNEATTLINRLRFDSSVKQLNVAKERVFRQKSILVNFPTNDFFYEESDSEKKINDYLKEKRDEILLKYDFTLTEIQRQLDYKLDKSKNQPQKSTSKTFETKLDDNGRIELCCKLVSEATTEIPTYEKTFIGNVDRPTLIYLLGGERPLKIKKIQMGGSHQNVYAMLLKISKHKNKKGKECLPDFLTKASGNICSQVLLDKDGKEITKLNNNTDY
jgi:hypothetical protein